MPGPRPQADVEPVGEVVIRALESAGAGPVPAARLRRPLRRCVRASPPSLHRPRGGAARERCTAAGSEAGRSGSVPPSDRAVVRQPAATAGCRRLSHAGNKIPDPVNCARRVANAVAESHHVPMLFIGPGADEATDQHEGFVAGRYRNGALSDIWTDVTRCAEGTFTAFVGACECGWRGPLHAPDGLGAEDCRREWLTHHFAHLCELRPALAGRSLGADDFLTPGQVPALRGERPDRNATAGAEHPNLTSRPRYPGCRASDLAALWPQVAPPPPPAATETPRSCACASTGSATQMRPRTSTPPSPKPSPAFWIRETVGFACELMCGNGIRLDHHVGCFVADSEAISTPTKALRNEHPHRRTSPHRHQRIHLTRHHRRNATGCGRFVVAVRLRRLVLGHTQSTFPLPRRVGGPGGPGG